MRHLPSSGQAFFFADSYIVCYLELMWAIYHKNVQENKIKTQNLFDFSCGIFILRQIFSL